MTKFALCELKNILDDHNPDKTIIFYLVWIEFSYQK